MALDLYAPCVCGSGKKIKFCCSDVTKELESITAAIEGGQRIAALDQINRALDSHPKSPALLALKGSTLLELNEFDSARKAVAQFLELAPQNPVALAQSAILCALDGNVKEAVLKTQQSLEAAGKEIPMPLYEAVAALSGVLLQLGHYLAGRQHMVLQVGLEGGEESPAFRQYLQIRGLESVPLILRSDLNLIPPPMEGNLPAADVAQWNAALESSKLARWFQAVEQFLTLATKHRQVAELWHNIAVLYGWLADEASASKAWRQKARCPNISAWDALEAEAVAQILDEPSETDMLPRIAVEFPVSDASAMKEKLLSTKRLIALPIDPAQFSREDNEVPPLAAFSVLTAEPPAESADLKMEQLPEMEGSLLLYGKQTDRDARCTFVTVKDENYDRQLADVKSLLGVDATPKEPENVGELRRFNRLWEFSRHVPTWAKPEQIKSWIDEFRQTSVLSSWERMPQSIFGNKSPAEAVQDETQQLAVSAALLELEVTMKESGSELKISELRERWNLPLPTITANTPNEIGRLPVWQWYWVDLDRVTVEGLERALNVALSVRARGVVQRVGETLIVRGNPQMHETVYAMMAQTSPNSEAALVALAKAKELRLQAGGSPATYLLAELPLLLRRGDSEEAQKVFVELRTKHLEEPGVANALTQIMVDLGLVSPQQLAAAQSRSAPSPLSGGSTPMPAKLAAAAGTPAPTWAPGQPITPAATEQPKSKLWLPGMD